MSELLKNNYSFSTHPHKILLILVIGGLSVLFLSFTAAYGYSIFKSQIAALEVPVIFFFNTLVLIGSSFAISMAKRAFNQDNVKRLKNNLLTTIGLTTLFLIGQILGWRDISLREISLTHSVAASYVYIISGLHMVHIVAGIPFLVSFYIYTAKLKNSVKVLLYFADSNKKLRLHLLATYWHFLDLVWLYLITFFAGYYFL